MELSDYEQLRESNIRRNAEKLSDLGLADAVEARAAAVARSRKRKRTPPKPKTAEPTVGTRRSSRHLGREPVNYKEVDVYLPKRGAAYSERDFVVADGEGEETYDDDEAGEEGAGRRPLIRKKRVGGTPAPPPPPSGSKPKSATIDIDFEKLRGTCLGTAIPHDIPMGGHTKNGVMTFANATGEFPSFSKFAGVVECRNGLVLFINVGGSDYNNTFTENGRKVTWFGGSKQHAETPSIKRLMRAENGKETVVLFLRIQTGERYVFCGEVSYVSHDAAVHPIKFVWELADYDAMLAACESETTEGKAKGVGEDEEEQQEEEEDNFRILLEAAGAL